MTASERSLRAALVALAQEVNTLPAEVITPALVRAVEDGLLALALSDAREQHRRVEEARRLRAEVCRSDF